MDVRIVNDGRARRRLIPILLAAGVGACGPNVVGTKPDSGIVSDAGAGGDADASVDPNAYPPGPYGAEIGDTIGNFAFAGYVNEHPDEGPVEQSGYVEAFSLQDVRELGRYDYLLLNVAAEWCAGCRVEAQRFPSLYEGWADKGGYLMSVIIEDASARSAAKRHLDGWVATYAINYTMLHDPQSFVAIELGPESLPLNVIVDLRTMTILHRVIGEDFTIFETFEALLSGE